MDFLAFCCNHGELVTYLLEDLKTFLDSSPTSWHAVSQSANRLAIQDFEPLDFKKPWDLQLGGKYFLKQGGFLIAFRLPEKGLEQMAMLAAHTDSPALKLKPKAEVVKKGMWFLATEVYGHPLLHTWLNRDLGIAGRVITSDAKGQLEEKLVFIDDAPVMIAGLPIHLDRDANEKGPLLNKQEHLLAIGSIDDKEEAPLLEKLLKRHLPYHKLVSHDLMLFPLENARYLGVSNEMLASYRLDNLTCVHAALAALSSVQLYPDKTMPLLVFFDHEEIGSKTNEGAFSPLLEEVLQRVSPFYQLSPEGLYSCKHRSLCLSLDMAHGYHPNFPDKFEPNHMVGLGKGIAFKFHAEKRYATDALSVAPLLKLCEDNHIAHQSFVTRSDIPSGSTIGPIIAQSIGIATVDLGIPQLSMHAAREVIACKDYLELYKMLTIFLSEKFAIL